MIETCWFYQCPDPECNCVGIINNVVLEHKCTNGLVKCPQCGRQMERIREALLGEYDPQAQEELAKWATSFKVTFVSPWEANHYLSAQADGLTPLQLTTDPEAPQPQETSFLTEDDAARILRISAKAVRQLVKIGKLGSIRLTKRKQVFTRALIDEFLQHQAGLCGLSSGGHQQAASTFRPANKAISLEQSRSLLKNLRKDRSAPDQNLKPISMKTRG